MIDKEYSTKQVEKIIGIPMRRIIHFSERGVLFPLIDTKGIGFRRKYNYKNLIEFKIANILYTQGFSIYAIKKILENHRKKSSNIEIDTAIDNDYIKVIIDIAKIKKLINNKLDGGNQ